MDEIERRHRWPTATAHERHDMLWPPSPAAEPKAGPGMRDLIRADDRSVADVEEFAHTLRTAKAMVLIEQELAREALQAGQTQNDAQAEFRKSSAIGQLLGAENERR